MTGGEALRHRIARRLAYLNLFGILSDSDDGAAQRYWNDLHARQQGLYLKIADELITTIGKG